MRVQIPTAHGQAIESRTQAMQNILTQYTLLRIEDRRHVNAVVEAAGLKPHEYGEYTLVVEGDSFFLDLVPQKRAAAAAEDPILTSATSDHPNGLPREQ
jgi:hypothetical protein